MKIYTSYFGQLKNLAKDSIVPIAICRYIPKFYNGLIYQDIAPSADILENCKSSHYQYINRFNKEILNNLSAEDVLYKIKELSDNNDCALLCYETPDKFCHRHIVADWLNTNLEINIAEYQHQDIQQHNALF